MPVLIQMKNIVKKFSGVIANNHINFELNKGEIHALLGENGSGKSTLMNILYGMYKPDEGEINIEGKKVHIESPRDAIEYGIGMVHQHFMLIPAHTVTENIILGFKSSKEPLLDTTESIKKIQELSDRFSLKVDPNAYVWQLSVGQQQRVEILKILFRGANILILDEPTSVLTPQETVELFKTLQSMSKQGKSIIFITHKLDEVIEISDRITILRNGNVISTVHTSQVTKQKLAEMMVGREIIFNLKKTPIINGKEILKIENVWVKNDEALFAVRGVNIDVREGEILGIAGVDGNGQRELAESIIGLRRIDKGKVSIKNQDVTNSDPATIYNLNTSYIPDERLEFGVVRDFTFQQNILLKMYRNKEVKKGPFIDSNKINNFCSTLISDYSVKVDDLNAPVKTFSGGNIQKVVLARELCSKPDLIIASQPTTGLDVGATESILKLLLENRTRGAAILLISTDLDEIFSLSDRIAVMYEGKIMGIVDAGEAKINEIGLMMGGHKKP